MINQPIEQAVHQDRASTSDVIGHRRDPFENAEPGRIDTSPSVPETDIRRHDDDASNP